MPEFVNPFSGRVPDRKLTDPELARAIRLNLAAEEEAIHLYEAHAEATDNKLARMVLLDIAREERVHAGEFQRLLNILVPDEEATLREGAGEVDEMVEEVGNVKTLDVPVVKPEDDGDEAEGDDDVPTVGNMKD